jgi:hypothetical protein
MTMTTRQTFSLFGRACAASLPALLLVACGGGPPVHSGYPEGQDEPWSAPKKLTLNDNLEASQDGQISFPKRERANWYVVELPAPGTLTVRVNMEPLNTGADMGVEVLDAGFNINAAGENDDDIGQEKKLRVVKEARGGRSYIHIYALGRGDTLDYKLRVKYEPKPGLTKRDIVPQNPADPRVEFPWTIPNPPPLASIKSDDTPKNRPPREEKPDDDPPPPPPVVKDVTDEPDIVRADIIEFSRSGSGVKILINKGSNVGVEEGWTGYIVDNTTKKSMPKSSFKIRAVRTDEAEGVTNVTFDDVQRNRKVVLKPSK